MKQNLLEIEKNIESRKETDRIRWFSLWIIFSVASFGIVWFPMIYNLIKRRNAHFSRQEKLEKLILSKLRKAKNAGKLAPNSSKIVNLLPSRNAKMWTFLSLLFLPAFYIFYFLISDLEKHEKHEHDFLAEVIALAKDSGLTLNIQGWQATTSLALSKYLVLSIGTFGLVAAYWLYRIFNDYNNHFRMQWKIEDELLSFLMSIDKETS